MSGTEQSEVKKEVAVVGGGLVGSLQAILLSQRGFRVHLYESRTDMRKEEEKVSGRSINLTLCHRGQEALKAVGLDDVVRQKAIPIAARRIHMLSSKPYTDYYGTRGECLYSINRRSLNELLLTKAEETPGITLHFEHKLTQASLEDKSLVFKVGTADPREASVKTDFIFGCDGAHSTVRQMMRWGRLNYSQEYMEHGYKELTLPPTENGDYAAEPNFLHVWPRQKFMMFALPNRDHSFTLTLVMPFEFFDSIKTEQDVAAFFMKNFPDIIDKMGADRLFQGYSKNPTGKLISVKCNPHFMANSTLLLGDAAHAVVPFYGQGVNAGFEDCLIFYNLLAQTNNDLATAAQKYQDTHWIDTQIICDLSMENYNVLCSQVTSRYYLLKRKLESFLYRLFPGYFPHMYTMMAFSTMPYHQVVQRHAQQRMLLKKCVCFFSLSSLALLGYLLFRYSGHEVVQRHARQRMLIRRGAWFFSLSSLALLGYLVFKYSGLEMSLKYRILPCVVKCVISD